MYAGSGAVGLEARSRGAARVTLVESVGQVARLIAANASALKLDRVDVIAADVERFVRLPPSAEPFDVVFLDPPYDLATSS